MEISRQPPDYPGDDARRRDYPQEPPASPVSHHEAHRMYEVPGVVRPDDVWPAAHEITAPDMPDESEVSSPEPDDPSPLAAADITEPAPPEQQQVDEPDEPLPPPDDLPSPDSTSALPDEFDNKTPAEATTAAPSTAAQPPSKNTLSYNGPRSSTDAQGRQEPTLEQVNTRRNDWDTPGSPDLLPGSKNWPSEGSFSTPERTTEVQVVFDNGSLTVGNLEVSPSVRAAAERAATNRETGAASWQESQLQRGAAGVECRASGLADPAHPDIGARFFARVTHDRRVHDGEAEMHIAHAVSFVVGTSQAKQLAAENGFPGGIDYMPPVVVHVDEVGVQTTIYEHPGGRHIEGGSASVQDPTAEFDRASRVAAGLKELLSMSDLTASLYPECFVIRDTSEGPALTLMNATHIRRRIA